MRIGLVSEWWLPCLGGAETSIEQLAFELKSRGVFAGACCACPELSDNDAENGRVPVTRGTALQSPSAGPVMEVLTAFESSGAADRWFDAVRDWAVENKLTHCIINDLRIDDLGLVARLRDVGVIVGQMWHGYWDQRFWRGLTKAFLDSRHWPTALDALDRQIAAGDLILSDSFGIPRLDAFDFHISNSATIKRALAKDDDRVFVLHPPLNLAPAAAPLAPRVNATISNPNVWKGGLISASMAVYSPPELTFRIMLPGWQNSEQTGSLTHWLKDDALATEDRIALSKPVWPSRRFLDATDVVVAPSRIEPYGMLAAEALSYGTPVITTDIPTIRESVGDGAMLVPVDAHPGVWIEALNELLGDLPTWRQRARRRGAELADRQTAELDQLVEFLERR